MPKSGQDRSRAEDSPANGTSTSVGPAVSGRRWLDVGQSISRNGGDAIAPRSGNVRLRHPPCPPCLRLLLLCRLTAGHTETQAVVVARRVAEVVAERRPTESRVVPPAAATNHAV